MLFDGGSVKTVSPDTTPSGMAVTWLNVELVTSRGPVTRLPLWVRPNTMTPLPSLKKSQVHVPTQSPVTLTVGGWSGGADDAQLAVARARTPIVMFLSTFIIVLLSILWRAPGWSHVAAG
jgi:hypothetical protein